MTSRQAKVCPYFSWGGGTYGTRENGQKSFSRAQQPSKMAKKRVFFCVFWCFLSYKFRGGVMALEKTNKKRVFYAEFDECNWWNSEKSQRFLNISSIYATFHNNKYSVHNFHHFFRNFDVSFASVNCLVCYIFVKKWLWSNFSRNFFEWKLLNLR